MTDMAVLEVQAAEPRRTSRNSGSLDQADTISIAEILTGYDTWGVPHFQRGSVWSADNVGALLESLYYNTPCGSIVLWAQQDSSYGVPLVHDRSFTHLIIDGQQRTRSVYAAFKGLFDATEDAEAENGGESQASDADAGDADKRYWAINLNAVDSFAPLLDAPKKRQWPLFVRIPDPFEEDRRLKERVRKGRKERGPRYNIPESPFKYNFVPLQYFGTCEFRSLLQAGRFFLKGKDGKAITSTVGATEHIGALERLSAKVQEMKCRRLFLRVLGSEVGLDDALKVFIRINSGGRPVAEEEKAFSALVGKCPTTNVWVKKIFHQVHDPDGKAKFGEAGLGRDEAMMRMNERSFGFKLFIRVFVLAASYHTGRSVGANSLSFTVLRDSRFLSDPAGQTEESVPQQPDRYDQLWATTARVVVALRRLLEERLKLDALQFLPETRSLIPVLLTLVKYPDLMLGEVLEDVRINPEFEAGLAHLALLVLLKNVSGQKVMNWATEIQQSQADAASLLDQLRSSVNVTETDLADALGDANSLNNRYTLLLYALERTREARDFDYRKNHLRGPDFEREAREVVEGWRPEKQHVVPYSDLVPVYNLESKSRVSLTEANNIGNITYISSVENSLGGLADSLLELGREPADNLAAHFIGSKALREYGKAKSLIEGEEELDLGQLKRHYRKWIQRRRRDLVAGLREWTKRLETEWLQQDALRHSKKRVEPVAPLIVRASCGRALAHPLRTLDLPDRVEDLLIRIFAQDGWQLESKGDENVLTLSLRACQEITD